MRSLIHRHPLLTSILSLASLTTLTAYLTKCHLDQSFPRIPITDLPKSSACRTLLETPSDTSTPTPTPWGMKSSPLLTRWSGGPKSHWIPSYVALQAEIPISQLESPNDSNTKSSTHDLTQTLLSAFLSARSTGIETILLDRSIPYLSFTPGHHLFGRAKTMGAFLLGTWSSKQGMTLHPGDLPSEAVKPVTEFCSNESTVRGEGRDVAGAVVYWKFPDGLVNAVDRAGLPWRLMEGGFQEFMVERVSEEKARVTYVCVECMNMYPGGDRSTRDWRMLPWVMYELHVVYAQVLWWKMMRRLRS
ncbi:hypothetical protein BO94DRAFT_623343 [Aspergillus sclerotioniger CBS 115572]|uniref:Uncharacterized protein n=1 Tax=Aspergillus sclerotioniger CBS 115572 TaxID=1450535 RepID=A0A317WX40_9EURO|nr:hypothetical protein BO94DRAFT_623343 [Aspergillus sclerotioniger CBS 115572]PWY90595.1 hypothetical protein BO94DRAFT_623343 [Aspergillus sclerotioniger CBS 115572]